MKSKATNQLLRDYYQKMVINTSEIGRLEIDNKEIRSQLTDYSQEKENTNQLYMYNFENLLTDLDIPQNQIEDKSEPGSVLTARGAYGPRCKVAQILAFLETKITVSPNTISFPLVIDSPNALEQDKKHLASVIRTLLTWDKTDNQIIIASIEGKETAQSIMGVNIITLTNQENHLFNSNEFLQYEQEISSMLTLF
jgi:hypothetical protein